MFRRQVFALILMVSSISFAQSLPKSCYGDYAGEMRAYDVVKNEIEMHIDKHDIKVSITDKEIVYSTGNITVKGTYSFVKQSKTEYLIKASFSNGKSLSYDMDFLWDKKGKTIHITGTNGEPDVDLEKLED